MKKIQIIVLVIFSIPGFIFLYKEFFPERNTNEELINKLNAVYNSNKNVFSECISIIDSAGFQSNDFNIKIWPKKPQFRVYNYENNNKPLHENFYRNDYIESVLRELNVSISYIKTNENASYFFLFFDLKDLYKRPAELRYWNKITKKSELKRLYYDYEIVQAPKIPTRKAGWIYTIDNHWFIKMDKKEKAAPENPFAYIFWGGILLLIIFFQVRKYKKRKKKK